MFDVEFLALFLNFLNIIITCYTCISYVVISSYSFIYVMMYLVSVLVGIFIHQRSNCVINLLCRPETVIYCIQETFGLVVSMTWTPFSFIEKSALNDVLLSYRSYTIKLDDLYNKAHTIGATFRPTVYIPRPISYSPLAVPTTSATLRTFWPKLVKNDAFDLLFKLCKEAMCILICNKNIFLYRYNGTN